MVKRVKKKKKKGRNLVLYSGIYMLSSKFKMREGKTKNKLPIYLNR